MDFVSGLGETAHILEIAVDNLGRVEVHHGRIRIVLVTQRDGMWVPAISLVWSVDAWKAALPHYEVCREIVLNAYSVVECTSRH